MFRKFFNSPTQLNFSSFPSSALTLKMINFCKNAACPTSPDLLAFQKGETSKTKTKTIGTHLPECEFCAAEIELYAHCPQAEENCLETEIPRALFELAEALLCNRQKDFSLLNGLLSDAEGVKI